LGIILNPLSKTYEKWFKNGTPLCYKGNTGACPMELIIEFPIPTQQANMDEDA